MKRNIFIILSFLVGVVFGTLLSMYLAKNSDENNLPTVAEATELVTNEWADFIDLRCDEGESICPKLSVEVTYGESEGESYKVLNAYIKGFGDDSFRGKKRIGILEWSGTKWQIKESVDFVLCRNGEFRDTGEVICH